MRRLAALLFCAAWCAFAGAPALGQSSFGNTTGNTVTTCGTPSPYAAWVPGRAGSFSIDPNGRLCITGTITFTPSGTQDVNLLQVAGAAVATGNGTAAGAIRVALPTDGTGVVGLIAGSSIVGKVGIDQTTPGTTNGTAIIGVNAATALAGNGATGTGSLRFTIANDNTLPAGWASSTATNQTAIQAPVAPATATATKSVLIGAQATTAAVNPNTGQQSALSSDSNNNLLTSAGGAPNLATSQASVTTGNISAASARALRRSIKITNVTGTGPVYCGNTGVTTSTGDYIGATAGSNIVINSTAAVFCTVPTTTQTVAVLETF